MDFEFVETLREIEIIARGVSLRDRARLRKYYGRGKWRKLKGIARSFSVKPKFWKCKWLFGLEIFMHGFRGGRVAGELALHWVRVWG